MVVKKINKNQIINSKPPIISFNNSHNPTNTHEIEIKSPFYFEQFMKNQIATPNNDVQDTVVIEHMFNETKKFFNQTNIDRPNIDQRFYDKI